MNESVILKDKANNEIQITGTTELLYYTFKIIYFKNGFLDESSFDNLTLSQLDTIKVGFTDKYRAAFIIQCQAFRKTLDHFIVFVIANV